MKIFILALFFVLIGSCAVVQKSERINYEENIGWMHGNCLALKNPNIMSPQEINIVFLEDGKFVETGTIIGKTNLGNNCFALLDDRKEVNLNNGYSFYLVESKSPVNLAIGYLKLDAPSGLDFNFCSTTEGIMYTISRGKSAVWEGYYYLGYESEATCKE